MFFFLFVFLVGFSIGTSNTFFLFPGDIDVNKEETEPGEFIAAGWCCIRGSPTGENGRGDASSSNPYQELLKALFS